MNFAIEAQRFVPPAAPEKPMRLYFRRPPALREELKQFQRLPPVEIPCVRLGCSFNPNENQAD